MKKKIILLLMCCFMINAYSYKNIVHSANYGDYSASLPQGVTLNPDTTLWYDEYAQDNMNVVTPPSDDWASKAKWDYKETRALPVGNGRLGAMVYGMTQEERLQINEATVWTGGPHNYANTLATPLTKTTIDSTLADILSDGETLSSTAEVYAKACDLVAKGNTAKATQLLDKYFMGNPKYQTAYQPFVDLLLNFGHDFASTQNYYRTLDVENALAVVNYDYQGVHYGRETLSSYPDQVIATNITSTDAATGNAVDKLSFSAKLNSPQNYSISKVSDNELVLKGNVSKSGGYLINNTISNVIYFEARLKIDTDGMVQFTDNTLSVNNATYATVYVMGGTNYENYKTAAGYQTDANGDVVTIGADTAAAAKLAADRCDAVKNHLGNKTYAEVRGRHISDYQNIYNRSSVDISGESTNTSLPYKTTDYRIYMFDGYSDLSLEKLYFNYGKYLLISSSRSTDSLIGEYGQNMLPKGQPANLQGIWSWKTQPNWGAKMTNNINVQMNYFMAQTANMSETELPLFDAIKELQKSGERTAKTQYGISGDNGDAWVLHHNFDIWRGTAPVDGASSGMWPTGGVWQLYHMWEYYQFTNDENFLRNTAYPAMKGGASFFEKYLKEYRDPISGKMWLVSPASISPEHGNVQLGPTMDHQLIRSLFTALVKAGQILGESYASINKWQSISDKIAPNQKVKSGSYLKEWLVDGVDEKVGNANHRHPSQLWGLHPGADVTPYDNDTHEQEIFDAFVAALTRRGDGATGWSAAWRMSMWARAGDGETAYKHFTNLIKKATAPNLFDMHPDDVFQIDGNLGSAAGIIEMLMQSTDGVITLMPAVPNYWKNGEFKGLVARGNYTVDLKWTENNADEAVVHAKNSGTATVRYLKGIGNAVVKDSKGNTIQKTVSSNKQKISFNVTAGENYTITGFNKTTYIANPAPKAKAEPLTVQAIAVEEATGTPISQGKPVTCSTQESSNPAANAVDGKLNTRWAASGGVYPNWVRVDLGSVYKLSKVNIKWYDPENRSYQYKLEVSNDDVNYQQVVDQTRRTDVGDSGDKLDVSARYVRVTVTGGKGSPCFYEFQVYEAGETVVTPAPTSPPVSRDNSNDAIKVYLNDKQISFDVPPTIVNDRTLVPMRAIFEALNAKVDWNGETNTVVASKGNLIITLKIGDINISVNNDVKQIDVPPMLISDRTMVPTRVIAESFGAKVDWDGETQSVKITTQ